MRCWRRSSSGVGMDLYLDSTSVSWAAEVGVKPRMGVWALEIGPQRRANARTKQPMPLGSFIEFTLDFRLQRVPQGLKPVCLWGITRPLRCPVPGHPLQNVPG